MGSIAKRPREGGGRDQRNAKNLEVPLEGRRGKIGVSAEAYRGSDLWVLYFSLQNHEGRCFFWAREMTQRGPGLEFQKLWTIVKDLRS